ncbi:MAG TPA: rod shape-determining protein RodA [Atribacteraceae bacterium]|nr:rod shape-determining protein RodA [Atribacteraceae bacterium]
MKTEQILITATLLLSVLGIVAVYSTDPLREHGFGTASFYGRQIIWAILGWVIFIAIRQIDYHWFLKLHWPLYFFVLLSLIAVLVYGSGSEIGVRSWLIYRSVQPSEFAKVGLIIFLASYLYRQSHLIQSWSFYIQLAILSMIPSFLIFIQPDLGTTLILVTLWFCAIVVSGFHWKKIMFSLAFLGSLIPILWPFLADYQKNRLLSFIDPHRDPLGSGYNVLQSKIAIGAGGFMGDGLLSGSQSQLRFLPARHTDFIFAAWCEQLGFLGGTLLIFSFMVLVWAIMHIAREAKDIEGKYLTTLIAAMFVFQILVNVGMNIGIMPITGLTLPFISYGGSSLVIKMIALGLVCSVNRFKGEN